VAARQLFAIDGLWCGNCARGLENRLRAQPGIEQVAVHFLTASALVQWDPALSSRQAIASVVRAAGYSMIERPQPAAILQRLQDTSRNLGMRLAIAVFFGMWAMAGSIALYSGSVQGQAAWWLAAATGIVALPVVFGAGSDILRMAVRSLRLRTPGIDLVISLGVLGSCLLSAWNLWRGSSHVYFDTATMLVTLLLLGRVIEVMVRRRALDAIVAMQAADNETALRLDEDGSTRAVPVAQVQRGERVLLRAGAVAAVDGVVEQGGSRLDVAILNGESQPQAVREGDRVSAGAVNLDSALVVVSDREPGDRDIDRMGGRIALELVARQPTADTQTRIAEWLGRWIPALAALTAVVVALLLGIERGLLHGLAVLVAACPCALAVATPLAHLQAAIRASRIGLRIVDPGSLPALAQARTAIFDKTGTLTLGRPQVEQVLAADGWTTPQVLAAAAHAEAGIEHPLAQAIRSAATRQGHAEVDPLGNAVRGERGVQGQWQGHAIGVSAAPQAPSGAEGNAAWSWLQVRCDDQPMGWLALADQLDPAAAGVVAQLQREGVAVQLASGDAEAPVQAIANRTGIDATAARGGMTPAQKADLVREGPHPLLFVGDGINDAPAMAAADCGISVARAHPATQATAAVGILQGGLEGVLDARALARWSQRMVRRNLGAALGYNAVIVPLAMLGWLTPLGAAVAMSASSLTQIALVLLARPPQAHMALTAEGLPSHSVAGQA